jgi:spore germination cell wall hydrolase CwlJ-like protein
MRKLFGGLVLLLFCNIAFSSVATEIEPKYKPGLMKIDNSSDIYCLAQNIYHEAKSESTVGQVAVGLVVMNRVRDIRYPDNVCDVVYQGPVRESWKTKQTPEDDAVYYPIKNKCQFSWYCDGKADTIFEDLAWAKAQELAWRIIVLNSYVGLVEGATHYHAFYVSPGWSREFHLVGRVDDHLFYRTSE